MTARVVTFLAFAGLLMAQSPDPRQLFDEALSAQQKGDYATAVDRYRELLKRNPGTESAWINLGVALVKLGRFDEAVESYRKALAIEPANEQVQLNLALAWYKKGDFASAATQFEQIAKTHSQDAGVATLLGECYLHLGQSERAVKLMGPLAPSASGNPDFDWVFGSALVASGRLKDGSEILERLARQTNAADAYMLAGDALLSRALYERARADLEKAAQINPALPGVYSKLGTARERNADYKGAGEAYRKAVEQNPRDLGALLGLGGVLYSERDLPGARAALEEALRLDPGSVDARYRLALVDKSEGHLEAAVAALEVVVKARPDWMPAHAELAALYFRLHRSEDGARERQAVDRLAEVERKEGP